MSNKKKKHKTIEELTKHFEEFSKKNDIKESDFEKTLKKVIKKHKKA
jgi:hypothetical protein